ncbi:hypothetical protein BLS_008605 [Venturia inaequalis]|uniref:Uncharacterized protein n=1 Tax=Venturia inaequalis TaxID=5025 RepID=A0A8H3V1Q7_VENIN|nr:hypothetical protein BLS_008605 [Venturia inaequalis]
MSQRNCYLQVTLELGSLHEKLTPDVVKAAASEVKEGVSISLNWPIGAIQAPGFGRKGLVHKVISFADSPLDFHGFDDEIEFNTQCSSQWDSLCHFNHQPTGTTYNGHKPKVEELVQEFGNEDKTKSFPTLNHWHERGGLVGRGVLIDYKAWADRQGIKYNPFDAHRITTKELEAVAKEEGVEFKQGDIILVRSGFTEALETMNAQQQAEALSSHRTCGVEGTQESAAWFWNKHFAAVAGDAIAFEAIPPIVDGKESSIADLVLHQYFLSLFGLPIGELWDLKALSEKCAAIYKRPAKAIKAAAPRAGTPVAAAPALEVEEAMLADEELNLLAEEARLLDAEEPVAVALRWC